MRTAIEDDLLRTLLWFSLFEYTPTSFELWKWMWQPSAAHTLGEVLRTLQTSKELQEVLREEEGVYLLRSTSLTPSLRRERLLFAERKMRRLRRVVNYLKRIPFVRGVAVCNTLAWMHTRDESDMDLFVIVQDGTIWTSRLLSVVPFLLRRARKGVPTKDPLCFSFFLSDANLGIESLQILEGDPYLAYWVRSLRPVSDRDGVFAEFQKANAWAEERLPQSFSFDVFRRGRMDASLPASGLRPPVSFESTARALQHRRFPQTITEMANRDSRVVVTDAMLKFHSTDRRETYRDLFENACRAFQLNTTL